MNNRQLAFCLIVCATFAVFAVLKLAHVITWSWWWVTSPLWGGLVLLVILLLWFLIAFAIEAHSGKPI